MTPRLMAHGTHPQLEQTVVGAPGWRGQAYRRTSGPCPQGPLGVRTRSQVEGWTSQKMPLAQRKMFLSVTRTHLFLFQIPLWG